MPAPKFHGLSYEQASRKAAELIAAAHATGLWWPLVDGLAELRAIMQATRVRRDREGGFNAARMYAPEEFAAASN